MRVPARLRAAPHPPAPPPVPPATILTGDARTALAALPAASVHCVFTSPPFFGLRDYDGPAFVWGGDPACDHAWSPVMARLHARRGVNPGANAAVGNTLTRVCPPAIDHGAACARCGAWKGKLGLEPTADAFVAHLVEVFESVARVLRPDGTLWVDLDDSYVGEVGPDGGTTKAEQLLLVPHRFAMAMQAAGWKLRMDAVWSKTSPKPDSVRGWHWQPHRTLDRARRAYVDCPGCPVCAPHDGLVLRRWRWRPVRTHEYVFLFSRTDTYFVDEAAVRQPGVTTADRALWSVWSLAARNTAASDDEHTATFPPKLVEIGVKAGTPAAGVCSACGTPYARVYRRNRVATRREAAHQPGNSPSKTDSTGWQPALVHTDRWLPACACGAPSAPAVVLDPFSGSGTTGEVALRLGRRYVGVDASPVYAAASATRLEKATAPPKRGRSLKGIAPPGGPPEGAIPSVAAQGATDAAA